MKYDLIFLDYDHCLANTDQLVRDLRRALEAEGLSDELWNRTIDEAVEAGYTPESHLDALLNAGHQLTGGREYALEVAYRHLESNGLNGHRYIFPDVMPWMVMSQAVKCKVVLVSFGHPEWQRAKTSCLTPFIDRALFTRTHGSKAATIYEIYGTEIAAGAKAVFVDNSRHELDAMYERSKGGVWTIHINRVPKAAMEDGSPHAILWREALEIERRPGEYRHRECTTLEEAIPLRKRMPAAA